MLRQVFQAVAYVHTHDILHVRVPRHSCCRYRRDFPRACVGEEVNVAVLLPNVPASIVVAPDFGRLQMFMRQRQATQRGTVCRMRWSRTSTSAGRCKALEADATLAQAWTVLGIQGGGAVAGRRTPPT